MILLIIKTMKQIVAQHKKTMTENASGPDFTLYPSPLLLLMLLESQYMEPINHGKPHPRNTFTAFDPFILPTDSSAYSDC